MKINIVLGTASIILLAVAIFSFLDAGLEAGFAVMIFSSFMWAVTIIDIKYNVIGCHYLEALHF